MSATESDKILVRVAPDGTCLIDDEYFAPPPGAPLNEAVLDHLRLEAAAVEEPIAVTIIDEQSNYVVTVQVNPDGTSQPIQAVVAPSYPPGPTSSADTPITTIVSAQPPEAPTAAPLALNHPYEALPEPFRSRLQTACTATENGDIARATTSVDQIIAELSHAFGPRHLTVVAAGLVRGDIALIAHDYEYGLRIWAFVAETWQDIVGQGELSTIPMVGNAVWCWSQLPKANALAAQETITKLLQGVPVPGSDASLQNVYRRIQLLA